ncbi:MAG: 3-oxoacyl-ACP synthase III [Verrucomicrobiota bacterium]
MRFQRTVLSGLTAELPPEVWSSADLESRLQPLYSRLRLPEGRLELMTGIRERRFWPSAIRPSAASAAAGRKAMEAAGVGPQDVDLLIHASVCRDRLEPSTAAYVHGLLGLGPQAQILDVSNACLGWLNAVVLAAGLVESGQIRRALVCAGEDGRPLVERTVRLLNEDLSLTRDTIKPYFANLTIGAGGAAAVVCRDDLAVRGSVRLVGGAAETDSSANELCEGDTASDELDMRTDSEALLAAGVALAGRCWGRFRVATGWDASTPSKVVTHQVGRRHSTLLFESLGLDPAKDCRSFDTLGNVGSASLPATFALARADGRICAGERVALLGIGSGLASLMLAVEC